MESLSIAKGLVRAGCYFTRLDLTDAYHSVPIAPEFRSFLAFEWQGVDWEWNVLPFGLSCAPRIFSIVLKAALANLRRLGLTFVQYLDDILVISPDFPSAERDINTIRFQLSSLGFLVNTSKSQLIPCQEVDFLGFKLDSL
jgi:hypothetical protein